MKSEKMRRYNSGMRKLTYRTPNANSCEPHACPEPDLPTLQERDWEIAREIVPTDGFRQLPTKFDVHECAIMRDFSYSVPSATTGLALQWSWI